MHKPYSLLKRKTKNAKVFVYYVRFRNPDTGERMTAISSGCTTKAQAESWAIACLKKGHIPTARTSQIFAEFAYGFWNDDSDYVVKHRIGKTHAEHRRSMLRDHLLPYFGKMKLSAIRVFHIEEWQASLKDQLSAITINHCLAALKTMLDMAYRKEIIPTNPAEKVERVPESQTVRGILTPEEIRLLFDEKTISTVWQGDFRHYALNLTALASGLRQGEVQGLRIGSVHDHYLEIVGSWERCHGMKGTKTGKTRYVTIPSKVNYWIDKVIDVLLWKEPDDLVFAGNKRGIPITASNILSHLYDALACIGIKEKDRQARGIVFHSHRHFFNSFLLGKGIAGERVRMMTGHSTEKMTDNYSHFSPDSFEDIRIEQEKLFE